MTKPYRPQCDLICIGNVIAGGAGKTPIAIAIAKSHITKGKKVAFLSKNYGGKLNGPKLVTLHDTHPDIGDEALLLAQTAPTVIAHNRRRGLEFVQNQGFDTIIMDDGYQNPTIIPSKRVLVLDGYETKSNGLLLPAGPLRQPLKEAKAMADIIIDNVTLEITKPSPPIENTYTAFCGIGQPDKFFQTLKDNHYTVSDTIAFPDHHPYSQETLDMLKGEHFITTEKDWVRLPNDWKKRVHVLKIKAIIPDETIK